MNNTDFYYKSTMRKCTKDDFERKNIEIDEYNEGGTVINHLCPDM